MKTAKLIFPTLLWPQSFSCGEATWARSPGASVQRPCGYLAHRSAAWWRHTSARQSHAPTKCRSITNAAAMMLWCNPSGRPKLAIAQHSLQRNLFSLLFFPFCFPRRPLILKVPSKFPRWLVSYIEKLSESVNVSWVQWVWVKFGSFEIWVPIWSTRIELPSDSARSCWMYSFLIEQSMSSSKITYHVRCSLGTDTLQSLELELCRWRKKTPLRPPGG